MFRKIYTWLISIRNKRQLEAKILQNTKQDSLIYPLLDDQKN